MAFTRKPPTLVVLQLTGGNDALNTLIPYGNPLYYDQRPTVRIPEDQILPIDDHYGLHPSMVALKPFWDQGKMAIINGIGYPKPDYSHFRSMDIWYTAQPDTMTTDGWLGKLVRDLDPKADNVLTAVSFGRGLPRALSLAGVPDLGTRVFYTAHNGFDTHGTQLAVHAQLWREVSEAVAAFFDDLRTHDAADDVIMLLWSEFGRRVRDNGSGTDHGAGGLAFVLGDAVRGGMYGEYPSLREGDLTLGNLTFTNDFRSTYSTILERWFGVEAKPIVNGTFEPLAFV